MRQEAETQSTRARASRGQRQQKSKGCKGAHRLHRIKHHPKLPSLRPGTTRLPPGPIPRPPSEHPLSALSAPTFLAERLRTRKRAVAQGTALNHDALHHTECHHKVDFGTRDQTDIIAVATDDVFVLSSSREMKVWVER